MSTFGHLSCQVARWAQGWPLPCPYSSSLQVSSGNRYLNVANSIMGPFPVLILPLKSSSVQRGSNTFLSNKMVRLTLAHCYQRLPNVNSSLELVSTPNGWAMRSTNSCFHSILVVLSLAKCQDLSVFWEWGQQENDRKWERQKITATAALKSDFMIMTWFFRDQTGLVHFVQLDFMDRGKLIIPDDEW